jgi:hypothetical protein
VDRSELVSTGADLLITEVAARSERVLVDGDLAALFGTRGRAAHRRDCREKSANDRTGNHPGGTGDVSVCSVARYEWARNQSG